MVPEAAPGADAAARWRLFVALPLTEAVRDALERQLAPYREAFPAARWLDPMSWHVTLLFLGHVPAAQVPALDSACASVAASWPAFAVDVSRGGGRSRHETGVAWLRVRLGARRVIELAEDLDRAVRCVPLGGAQPRRAPSAHVTVARRAEVALLRALELEVLGSLGIGWQVDRVHLMRSHLDADGARYEVLRAAPLSGA
ncbi:RNA 2',3'-cyclic phosphodiesterase [soil metagenome]